MKRPSILLNALLILIVGVLGFVILYMSLSLFTKHGQSRTVPSVVKMSYTDAINKLDALGFKVEISDSVYNTNVRPGYVVEQTPAANTNVKPGRVVYLIINAVTPQRVAIANMQGVSLRQAKAVLERMGFTNIRVSYKLGKHKNLVLGIKVNGRTVRNGQKVPVNAPIVIEVSNGRVSELADSLLNAEYGTTTVYGQYDQDEYETPIYTSPYSGSHESSSTQSAGEYEEGDPYAGQEPISGSED